MTDQRSAWDETGERLSSLGSSLRTHYERQRGSEGAQTKQELEAAIKQLGSAVRDAFDAVGAAAKDPEVRDDVKKVGQSLSDALGATFGEVSQDLRRTFAQRKGDLREPAAPGAPEAGPSEAGPSGTGSTGAGSTGVGTDETRPPAPS